MKGIIAAAIISFIIQSLLYYFLPWVSIAISLFLILLLLYLKGDYMTNTELIIMVLILLIAPIPAIIIPIAAL